MAVDRVRPLLQKSVENANYDVSLNGGSTQVSGGVGNVAFYADLSVKCISDILNKRREVVSVSTLDKLLCGLNLEYLAHHDEEDGGFRDVFDNIRAQKPPERRNNRQVARKKVPCLECGGTKSKEAARCQECREKKNDALKKFCSECKTELSHGYENKSGMCRPCYDGAGGSYAYKKAYKKGAETMIQGGGYSGGSDHVGKAAPYQRGMNHRGQFGRWMGNAQVGRKRRDWD